MANILLVCTANICRSPVAEALLREYLQNMGLEWDVNSAGTWAEPGQSASAFGVELMAEQGLDISRHTSKGVDGPLLSESDLVLCMESGHAEALRAEFPCFAHKIYMLTEMSDRRYSVPDPYGGPRKAYERMVGELTGLIETGLPRIIELAQTNAQSRLPSW